MRRLLRVTVLFAASVALAAAGCDNDTNEGTTDNGSTPDSVVEDDNGGGDPDVPIIDPGQAEDPGLIDMGQEDPGPPDIPPENPCDPNPCYQAPDCVDNAATTYAGTCTDNAGVAECSFAVASTTPCEGDTPICDDGMCRQDISDPCDYQYSGQASYVHYLGLGGVGDLDNCCFDFDGDGEINNALGTLVGGIGGLIGGDVDINAELLNTVKDGTIAILFEYLGLDDATNDTDLAMNGFYGAPADPATGLPYDPVPDGHYDTVMSVGDGVFVTNQASFMEATAEPLIGMPGVSITNGVLEAGPAVFELVIDFAGIALNATVSGAMIEGPVNMHANGKGLEMPLADGVPQGKLGGYVFLEDLFDALNGYIINSCQCLGLTEGLINYDSETVTATCNSGDDTTCDPTDDEICVMINQYCAMALIFLKGDLDTDDDGLKEAMSVGVWLAATAGEIYGTGECMEPAGDAGASADAM